MNQNQMKEENENKVYARSNFDLNKVINTTTPTNPKIFNPTSNNLAKSESLNFIMNNNENSNPSQDLEDVDDEDRENSQAAQNSHTDEDRIPSSSASAGGKKRRKKLNQFQSHVSELSSKASRMQLQHNYQNGNGAPTLSREDRKNAEIMKMIERQEKLRIRREAKKSGIPIPRSRGGDQESDSGNSNEEQAAKQHNSEVERSSHVNEARRGPGVSARVKPGNRLGDGANKQQALLSKKQKPSVSITVVFSETFQKTANHMTRYFYERKQTLEEKQRQEFGCIQAGMEQWATNLPDRNMILQHCLMMSQEPRNSNSSLPTLPPNFYQTHTHQLNMHVHAGTGGPYNTVNINEDYSQTSSFSSSSKRQRLDDYGQKLKNQLQMINGGPFISQSVPPNIPNGSPKSNQNGSNLIVPKCCLRSVSEECVSVENFENEIEVAKEQEIAVQHPAQQILDQQSDHASGTNEEELLEMQRVIELTRQLQKNSMLKRSLNIQKTNGNLLPPNPYMNI